MKGKVIKGKNIFDSCMIFHFSLEITIIIVEVLFLAILQTCCQVYAISEGEVLRECERPYQRAPLFPDPTNCTRYYECHYDGYLIRKNCPEKTRFNPKKNWCVHKGSKKC